jgi:RNA polymerase Rpb8
MEDLFKIIGTTTNNFKNVTRITAISSGDYKLEIDVNNLFFDVMNGKDFRLVLSKQIDEDADYIMKGLLLKKDANNTYVSYSGLLMHVDKYIDIDFDTDVYCNIFRA